MKTIRLMLAGLILASIPIPSPAQTLEKELPDLATKLGSLIRENGKKKVTVLDFTDLQGGGSELGKYIAEELTVNLVMIKKDFAVLDRANLASILREHKLTSTGLVDPENAKKIGQFAGVDTLILGTIVPMDERIQLTAKLITTDTAEIVGAAKAFVKTNNSIQQLISVPAGKITGSSGNTIKDETKVSKTVGNLRVDVKSLSVLNDKQFKFVFELVNLSPDKTIWAALRTDNGTGLQGELTDKNSREFVANGFSISGIELTTYRDGGIFRASEIRPKEHISVAIKFSSWMGDVAAPGQCRVRFELLLANTFAGNFAPARPVPLSMIVATD